MASNVASLVAQLVKNPPAMQETPVRFLGPEDCWRRDRLSTPVFLGFPGGSDSKESACSVGDLGSIPGLGRSSGGEHGKPRQHIKKQRHYFANKGLSSQSYGFSNGHVWM